jgi:uncharacterized protein involved in type VI secretion and phage assembly
MLLDLLAPRDHDPAVERQRLYGVYAAQVTDVRDPDGQGRVKVKLPWSPDLDGGGYEVWARLAVPMAGNNRGTWLVPDPNDEVLVAFEGGDPRQPRVIGSVWNGRDAPPETMDGAGKNFKKTICSRNGVRIVLDDSDGRESLTLKTPAGQQITFQDGPSSIELRDANGNTVKLDSTGISLTTSGKLTVSASTIEFTASMATVNAATSKFSGLVKSDAVTTNSVVSASYSPGAGNIW